MFWVFVGIFSDQSKKMGHSYHVYVEDASKGLAYPTFHIRTADSDNSTVFNASSIVCQAGPLLLPPQNCDLENDQKTCFRIDSKDLVSASADDKENVNRLRCRFSVIPGKIMPNRMIVWGEVVDGETDAVHHANAVWIGETANAWILLRKSVFKDAGHPAEAIYEKNLDYHSTVTVNNSWDISLVYQSFDVFHYDSWTGTGWISFANVGGSIFFLSLLVTIVMIPIGWIVGNESKVLNQGHPQYASVQ
jgi:hypothetical protein